MQLDRTDAALVTTHLIALLKCAILAPKKLTFRVSCEREFLYYPGDCELHHEDVQIIKPTICTGVFLF